MDKMIPFYNTENIPGQKYELISTVKGSMIQSKHLGRDIGNMLKSVVGGELRGYSEMLNEARQLCKDFLGDLALAVCPDVAFRNEPPVHRVELDSFWIDKT